MVIAVSKRHGGEIKWLVFESSPSVLICKFHVVMLYFKCCHESGLHKLWQPGCEKMEREWGNGEIMRKWRGSEEMERE